MFIFYICMGTGRGSGSSGGPLDIFAGLADGAGRKSELVSRQALASLSDFLTVGFG